MDEDWYNKFTEQPADKQLEILKKLQEQAQATAEQEYLQLQEKTARSKNVLESVQAFKSWKNEM